MNRSKQIWPLTSGYKLQSVEVPHWKMFPLTLLSWKAAQYLCSKWRLVLGLLWVDTWSPLGRFWVPGPSSVGYAQRWERKLRKDGVDYPTDTVMVREKKTSMEWIILLETFRISPFKQTVISHLKSWPLNVAESVFDSPNTRSSALAYMTPWRFSATHWYIPESSNVRLLKLIAFLSSWGNARCEPHSKYQNCLFTIHQNWSLIADTPRKSWGLDGSLMLNGSCSRCCQGST